LKINVFGLGKLGSVLAAVYAQAGHDVVGVDINQHAVEAINAGKAPIEEPGLQSLITEAGSRLRATTSVLEALNGSEASYLILPTPSNSDGEFVNDYLIAALSEIGKGIRNFTSRHTVVICSTVMPGSCDGVLRQTLESASGKAVGGGIGLVYSPEFIALGSVVRDMHYPDLILIGESDPEAGDLVESNALGVVRNLPRVARLNMVNAEITKIAINTFVTTKISFANMLSEICDQLPGADVDLVTGAVGSDSRIGTKYLKGALGYGGPCFPRDNIALTRLAELFGVDAALARATDRINDRQIHRVIRVVEESGQNPARVAVLGLSYKPETPVCERSQGLEIANELAERGHAVSVFDPQAMTQAAPYLSSSIRLAQSAEDAISDATVVLIATAWREFENLDASYLSGRKIIDPWGVLPHVPTAVRLGKSQSGNVKEPAERTNGNV